MKDVATKQQPGHAEAAATTSPQAAAKADALAPAQGVQRAVGNFAVQRFLQAKLRVGASGDPLEREADRAAEQISGAHSRTHVHGALQKIGRLPSRDDFREFYGVVRES